MKVAELISGTAINGAVTHCLLLTRELARNGHSVTVVCRPDAWIRRQLAPEIEVIESDFRRWPIGELRRVAAELRRRSIEVLHTHMSSAHFFGVLLRRVAGIPTVATAHSRHFQLHWTFNDYVIAVSQAVRRFHVRYNFVPAQRIRVIHNFVDVTRFAVAASAPRLTLRSDLGIAESAPLVGSVGSLIAEKGVDRLIDAFAQVVRVAPEARLVIVGDGPAAYVAGLRARAGRLGVDRQITWLGQRTDIAEIVASLDVMTCLSRWIEPFGLVVAEAMAGGVPVVASTVGGIPECVRHQETGLLVPAGDSAAAAQAITVLLRNPDLRRRYGSAAQARARSHFSIESQLPQVERVLRGVRGKHD